MLPTLRRVTAGLVAASAAAAALPLEAVSPIGGLAASEASTGCPTPKHAAIRTAPGAGKTVALTFDDGPTTFTPQILAILREHNVRATFFTTGAFGMADPDGVRQVVAEGHLLGNHTWDHRYPTQVEGGWSRAYLGDQLARSNKFHRELAGRPSCFFRPPGGYQTPGMIDIARSHGLTTVMWSVDTQDWRQPGRTTAATTNAIISRAKAGGSQQHPIVLMHDGKASYEPESQVSSNRSNSVKALPAILSFYKSRGYRFVDMFGRSGLPPAPTLAMGTEKATTDAGSSVNAARGTQRDLAGPVSGVKVCPGTAVRPVRRRGRCVGWSAPTATARSRSFRRSG